MRPGSLKLALLGAASITALGVSPALAADVTPLASNWTGAYIGAGVGGSYAFTDLAIDDTKYDATTEAVKETRSREADLGAAMFLGTVEAGYDYQVGDQVVLGIVGNFDFRSGSAELYSDKRTPNNPEVAKEAYDAEVEVGNSWGIGARAGMLFGPRTLVYATGGYTQADLSVDASYDDKSDSSDDTKDWSASSGGWESGFYVGGGIETMLTDHISAKLEYRFSRYGDLSAFGATEVAQTGSYREADVSTGDVNISSIRATVAYRFGDGITSAEADAPAVDWTGFYAGGGVGDSFAFTQADVENSKEKISDSSVEVGTREYDAGINSFMGTVEAGFDYQISSNAVVGLLGNYDFRSGSAELYSDKRTGNNLDVAKEEYNAEVELGNAWAIGARAGFLTSPGTLLYVSGGYTQADLSVSASYTDKEGSPDSTKDWSASDSSWSSGYFVGGGIEHMFSEHLSGKLEYRYANYDGLSVSAEPESQKTGEFREGTISTDDLSVHAVRATLAWRF